MRACVPTLRGTLAAGTLYQQLVETVDRNTDPVELAVLVSCLSRCTASLHKDKHAALTSVVLRRCFRADDALAAATEAFAVNCVSVNADLLTSVLQELVKHYAAFDLLAADPPDTARERASQSELSREDIERQVRNARDVHRAVQRVLETFPTGTMCFFDQLVQAYPHRVRRIEEQRAYLANILHVTGYQPQLLNDVLEHITERLIKIDVEVDPHKLDALNSGAIDVAEDGEHFEIEMEEV